MRVDVVLKIISGFNVSVEAVFGRKERDEFGVGCAAEDIDGAFATPVHAGGMSEEADSFPGDSLEAFGLQHVDAEHDREFRNDRVRGNRTGVGGWLGCRNLACEGLRVGT